MSMPTNTYDTTAMKGIREDLDDVIYNIAPFETPLISIIERDKATQVFHEWQTDSLATPTKDNAVIQGDDVSADAATATGRIGNHSQLMDKVVSVTSTAQASTTAGRKDELPYQLAKRAKELKTDIESACMQNNHAVALVSDTTASKLGGLEVWLATNASHGVGGSTTVTSSGAPTATKLTDGSTRAFTETLLTAMFQSCFDQGSNPSKVFLGAFNKGQASSFTGNATKTINMTEQQIVQGVDVYVHDFGRVEFIPARHCRTRTVLGINPEYLGLSVLQPTRRTPLAKTGHSDRVMLSTELTLKVSNQKAHFKVADLTTA